MQEIKTTETLHILDLIDYRDFLCKYLRPNHKLYSVYIVHSRVQ